MDGTLILEAARKAVAHQVRKRYLARGPLIKTGLNLFVAETYRRLTEPADKSLVHAAVQAAVLQGRVLGRYECADSDDWWTTVTAALSLEILRARNTDLRVLVSRWREAPGNSIDRSYRYGILLDHVNSLTTQALTHSPQDKHLVIPAFLEINFLESSEAINEASDALAGIPANALGTLLRQMMPFGKKMSLDTFVTTAVGVLT